MNFPNLKFHLFLHFSSYVGRLGGNNDFGRGRGPVRPPAHVRFSGLGSGHVLRGHRARPLDLVPQPPVRPRGAREKLHHLFRHLLRADGRRPPHRHPDQLQVSPFQIFQPEKSILNYIKERNKKLYEGAPEMARVGNLLDSCVTQVAYLSYFCIYLFSFAAVSFF